MLALSMLTNTAEPMSFRTISECLAVSEVDLSFFTLITRLLLREHLGILLFHLIETFDISIVINAPLAAAPLAHGENASGLDEPFLAGARVSGPQLARNDIVCLIPLQADSLAELLLADGASDCFASRVQLVALPARVLGTE